MTLQDQAIITANALRNVAKYARDHPDGRGVVPLWWTALSALADNHAADLTAAVKRERGE